MSVEHLSGVADLGFLLYQNQIWTQVFYDLKLKKKNLQ
jgi:hypothetical protein